MIHSKAARDSERKVLLLAFAQNHAQKAAALSLRGLLTVVGGALFSG
jgi:hypothetical protein